MNTLTYTHCSAQNPGVSSAGIIRRKKEDKTMEEDLRTIDFTSLPAGEEIGNRAVEVCPRCGRRGLATHVVDEGGGQEHRFLHLGFAIDLPGAGKWLAPLVQCQVDEAA